jgi:hypothetical protein
MKYIFLLEFTSHEAPIYVLDVENKKKNKNKLIITVSLAMHTV